MKCLLLPGFACTSSVWRMVVGSIAELKCQAVDWPVDQLGTWAEPADFSRWLLESGLGAGTGLVVGHSMGGLVALDFARRQPVRGVVLVESFLHAPPPAFRNLVHAEAPAGLSEEVHAMLAGGTDRYSLTLKNGLRTGAFVAESIWPDRTPVLTIYGRRDYSMNPADVAHELGLEADTQRGPLSVALVPKACHFPMLENPAAFTAILRQWVERLLAATPSAPPPAGA